MTTQPVAVAQNVPSATGAKDISSQLASIYVGDLNAEVTEAVLYEIFNAIGPVASIRVCRDSVTRRSLGYAYVNFHQVADAERAIEALNYTDIKGIPCRIMWVHRDPASRRTNSANVYIKNLDKSIDNRSLYDTFSVFGNVLSCKIATDAEGKSRGFAFVHYENEEAANAAIEKCNGMQLGDKTVFVGPFAKQTERPTSEKPFTNIYVKHLPASWDDERLRAEFTPFGEVTSVALCTDSKSRRFAFVNFKQFDEAKEAVTALHGKDVRTEEEKAAVLTEEQQAELEAEKDDECYTYQLYVVRAQTKTERAHELKNKFSSGSMSSQASVASPTAAPKVQNANLYIKNLSETVDDEELHKMFAQFGEITSARIMRDEKNVSRCFGFVCFANAEDATRAVTEMHLKLVNGKPLYVGLHERREQRLERLQQRYRLNPMMAGPGMMSGPAMMMQRPAVSGQFPGMYGQTPQPVYYSGMPAGPRPGMPQQPQMMGQRMAPQVGGFPGQQRPAMPGQMNPYMMGGMNPQAAAAMRAASGMMPGGPTQQPKMVMMPGSAGMRPPVSTGPGGMPMRPQPVGAGMVGMRGPAQQYQFNTQARNQAGMPMMMGGQMGGWPEPQAQFDPAMPLTAAALAAAPPAMQKQMLGEKLFPLITKYQPELAGKITGMMLEMDNSELLILLESEQQLRAKVEEAMRVLQGQ